MQRSRHMGYQAALDSHRVHFGTARHAGCGHASLRTAAAGSASLLTGAEEKAEASVRLWWSRELASILRHCESEHLQTVSPRGEKVLE